MESYYHTEDWASSMMLESANKLRLLAEKDRKQESFPFLVPSILMAFTAIETCINESIHYKLKSQLLRQEFWKFIEKKLLFINIEEKLLKLTEALTGKTFEKKSSLWKKFKNLKDLRNKLMHYKLKEMTDKEVKELQVSFDFINIKEEKKRFEIIRETFYKDLIHKEVNADKAKEAIETAKQVMNSLNFYYFGVKKDSYKLIKT